MKLSAKSSFLTHYLKLSLLDCIKVLTYGSMFLTTLHDSPEGVMRTPVARAGNSDYETVIKRPRKEET